MRIVVITGQTATGKTTYALNLVKKENGELINCDSRQIYKHMDIITGKDKPKNVKINLYDIITPNQYFSSFDYVQHALPIIKKILTENKTPIIVGGSYLYLKHLLYNIETENILPNWRLRKKLADKTLQELQEILKKKSVQSFNRLNNSDKNNPQRLIRKIEISQTPFEPSQLELGYNNKIIIANKLGIKNIDVDFIGLYFKDKEELRRKIIKRVENRLNQGAISEVKNLLKMDYKENDPGLKTIGYQQIIKFLNGKISKEKAIEEWVNKEIQYAKRQYTFMKKDKNIRWTILS